MPLPADTACPPDYRETYPDILEEAEISGWKQLTRKRDNLFLLMLCVGLFSFSTFLFLLINKSAKQAVLKKQQGKSSGMKWNVQEISLGEFESMKTSPAAPGYLSVIHYETSLSVEGTALGILQEEREIYSRRNRIRSIVELVVNSASEQELNEPDLATLRASVLERVNEALGENKVKDVLFPHYVRFRLPTSP